MADQTVHQPFSHNTLHMPEVQLSPLGRPRDRVPCRRDPEVPLRRLRDARPQTAGQVAPGEHKRVDAEFAQELHGTCAVEGARAWHEDRVVVRPPRDSPPGWPRHRASRW